MGFHTLLIMLMFGYIPYKTKTLPIDCGKPVQKCPVEKKEWKLKNDEMKCARNEGYVCMADYKGYLLESCMLNFTIQAHSANCPVILACNRNRPFLGTVGTYIPCPDELHGCPPTNHEEYSIYQLYKYPNCIRSNAPSEEEINSTRKNQTLLNSTIKPDEQRSKSITLSVILPLVLTVFLLILAVSVVSIVYFKRKDGTVPFSSYFSKENTETEPLTDEKGKEKQLRDLILDWNEIQTLHTERFQILPLDEDDPVEIAFVDVYTQVILRDESDKRASQLDDKSHIQNTTLDKIFLLREEKPARFIFMLGEAGYGKTVQCQQITRSWCQAWRNENCQDDVVGTLKVFDFLFFVKLRDTRNNNTSLIDIILEAYSRYHPSQGCLNTIRTILEQGKCRSLVILDGLDEWNIPDADRLLDKGIPNCRNMCNCTILISMRSWKFIEVKQIRLHQMDKVVRLCGLDERGFEFIAEKMLCRCLNMDKASAHFQAITKNIRNFISASSYAAQSLMKIPFLAVLFIHAFHYNVRSHCGHSMTALYLSIIETLMERSKQYDEKSNDNESVYATLRDFTHLQNHGKDLSNLGKIAFSGLTSENKALIFKSNDLNENVLQRYFKIGFLIKAKAQGQLHGRNFEISFLHKTIQEFLAAFYLWTEGNIVENFLRKHVLDVEKALEFSMVLTFLSGLSSVNGSNISRHLKDLASTDEDIQNFRLHFASDSYEKVFHLYDLQLRCYREIRHQKNKECFSEDDELKFSFSDIILHGKDSDRQLIRDTADVLLKHPHDIESLQMKFIPDDEQNGISNDELKNFLDKSTSIKSVNIDGYVEGKCRVFSHFSQKMSSLITLGLHNIAIEGEILTNLFTRNTTRNFQALGLSYIRSSADPSVRFQYNFLSGKTIPSQHSGFERKKRMRALPTLNFYNNNYSVKPLLTDILRVLPNFELLTTLHISYMESLEDRNILLGVAKELKKKGKLETFGYQGSAMYNVVDDQHDTEIIEVILTMNQLQYIFLCDISLINEFPVFPEMLQLKKFDLQDISLNKMEWRKLVTTLSDLSNNACLEDVVLTDTDIDDESLKLFEVAPGLSIKMIPT